MGLAHNGVNTPWRQVLSSDRITSILIHRNQTLITGNTLRFILYRKLVQIAVRKVYLGFALQVLKHS